jgi:hypothetical protein
MIDKEKILDTVAGRLKNLPVGHYLNLRTYKRNRSVIIVKQSENNLLIIEDGFSKEKFCITSEKLKKLLTTLLRKEFPRSHKIRLYVMGKFIEEEEARNTTRKLL